MQESYFKEVTTEKLDYIRQALIGKNIYDVLQNDLRNYNNFLNIENNLTKKFKLLIGNELKFKLISYSEYQNKLFVNDDFFLDFYSINHNSKKIINEKLISSALKSVIFLFYQKSDTFLQKNTIIIDYLGLIEPTNLDFYIIQNDYDYLLDELNKNKTKKIINQETMYLGIQLETMGIQPDLFEKEKIGKLFLKKEYLSYYLNNFFNDTNHNIKEVCNSLLNYEEILSRAIDEYIGESDFDLCKKFNLNYDNRKSQWIEIVYSMLKIKSNKYNKLEDTNLSIRTIKIEENGKIRESIPLSPIKLQDVASEKWHDSILYKYFSTTKFLFFIFKKKENEYVFKGLQFWEMNINDLNSEVYKGWKSIKDVILNGIDFELVKKGDSYIVKNNLPSKKDNKVIHIRPHAKKACYRLKNGFEVGDKKDGDRLPDGQYITKQSFWINNSYILSVIDNQFLN